MGGLSKEELGWNLDASIWANPFTRKQGFPPGSTLPAYEQYVQSNPALLHKILMLVGKTLGCWCKPKPCHGDVLVKLVKEFLEKEKFEDLPDVDAGMEDVSGHSEQASNHFEYPDTDPTTSATCSMEGITVTIGTTYLR